MFEHMAFKGTETIGSKDPVAEQKALNEVERVYDQLDASVTGLARRIPQN